MKGRIATFQRQIKWIGPNMFLCIYFQGCFRACKGCESIGLQKVLPPIDMQRTMKAILSSIREDKCFNIMISGGEPLLQPKLLLVLLRKIRKIVRQMGGTPNILLYSGYQQAEIQRFPYGKKILRLISVLVDGEYIDSLNDGRALRGSTNQRIIFFDSSVESMYRPYLRNGRHFEIVYDELLGKFIGLGLKPKYIHNEGELK